MKIKLNDKELLSIVNMDKEAAVNFFNDKLKDKIKKFEEMFDGDPDFYNNNPDFRMPASRFVSRDIMITIRTLLPDIIRLLSTNEPVDISGRSAEDVEKSRKMQALVNWQVTQLNPYFTVFYRVYLEALLKGYAPLKIIWEKRFETQEKEEEITEHEINNLKEQGAEIISSQYIAQNEYSEIVYLVRYRADFLTKNQPVFTILPSAEFLFDPMADSVENAQFCIHRKVVTMDYLKRKEDEGIYKNIDKIKKYPSSFDEDETDLLSEDGQYKTDGEGTKNKARQTVVLNEYWGKIDIDQDGRLEFVVLTFVGDVILSIEENTFEMYPFFIFTPFPSSFSIIGTGMGELVENVQNVKTTLVRELLDNVRRNNDRKFFFKSEALLYPSQMNDPKEKYVEVDGKANMADIFAPEPFDPLSNYTQVLIEYFDRERQNNSGVSEIKQGLRSNSGQTATEATIKYEASNSQAQTIAITFAETFKKAYEFIVYQNQKFIDEPQIIRLLNVPMEVKPEDIQGVEFDLKVSASLGTGTTETRVRTLSNALNTLINVAEPRGLTDKIRERNVIAKIFEALGLKDVDNYLLSEEEIKMAEESRMINSIQPNGPAALLNNSQPGSPALLNNIQSNGPAPLNFSENADQENSYNGNQREIQPDTLLDSLRI